MGTPKVYSAAPQSAGRFTDSILKIGLGGGHRLQPLAHLVVEFIWMLGDDALKAFDQSLTFDFVLAERGLPAFVGVPLGESQKSSAFLKFSSPSTRGDPSFKETADFTAKPNSRRERPRPTPL